jgi:hypothetical protein
MTSHPLRQLLYISRLSDHYALDVVGRILHTARANNAIFGETGVLLFDGERFCQLLEGTDTAIGDLLRKLLDDDRHQDVRVLADHPIAERRYPHFRMGYADITEVDALDDIAGQDAQQALDVFHALASQADVTT